MVWFFFPKKWLKYSTSQCVQEEEMCCWADLFNLKAVRTPDAWSQKKKIGKENCEQKSGDLNKSSAEGEVKLLG